MIEILAALAFLGSVGAAGFYAYILGSIWNIFSSVGMGNTLLDFFVNALPLILIGVTGVFWVFAHVKKSSWHPRILLAIAMLLMLSVFSLWMFLIFVVNGH